MTKQRVERKFTWLNTGFYLPGIVLLMMFSPLNAETGLQDDDYWAPVQQSVVQRLAHHLSGRKPEHQHGCTIPGQDQARLIDHDQ